MIKYPRHFNFSVIIFLTMFCGLSTSLFSQNVDAELRSLQKSLTPLLENGRYEEVIKIGEQIVAIEEKRSKANRTGYVAALMNLALWKKQALIKGGPTADNQIAYVRGVGAKRNEVNSILQKIIRLTNSDLTQATQHVSALLELALWQIRYPGTEKEFLSSENLFLRALAIQDENAGLESEESLFVLLKLADFYALTAEFEKYLLISPRLLEISSRRWSAADKRRLALLKTHASVLLTAGQQNDHQKIVEQVRGVPGNESFEASPSFFITKRAVPLMQPLPSAAYKVESPGSNSIFVEKSVYQLGDEFANQPTGFSIPVQVVVNERGNVEETIPAYGTEKVGRTVDKLARKWKFRALKVGGLPSAMTGTIIVAYYADGSEVKELMKMYSEYIDETAKSK
jgi:hypothetical protein